jgi:hypothetical protein
MSDLFLEKRISIKFYVKLRKNASDTCAILSESYVGEAMKMPSVFEWYKQFKEGRMSKSPMEKMPITFFDIKGIVRFEFISQGQTVNETYYVEILKRLHEAVCRKRPELCINDWIFHHDNSPTIKQFLAQKSITEMEHPTSSHNLAPNDFCFQK